MGGQYIPAPSDISEKLAYAGASNNALLRPMTMPERLRQRRESMAQQLKEIDEAIAALDAHPDIEKVLHLLSRVTGY